MPERHRFLVPFTMFLSLLGLPTNAQENAVHLDFRVIDAKTREPLPARVYLESEDGTAFHAKCFASDGEAIPYRKVSWLQKRSREIHTSLSAHPARFEVPPGTYTLTVERGKEYFTHTETIELEKNREVVVRLRRWIDMAARGWYSGETHVHRSVSELPTLVLVEDLNAAFPLPFWVTRSGVPPTLGDKSIGEEDIGKRIHVDATHVIHTRNTEYEIFSVGKTRHTLGAVFVINHREPLTLGVPPVRAVAEEARRQGALLELDKHNWPWSMAIVPLMDVDLYELANNHHWRTHFAFGDFGEKPSPSMNVEMEDGKFTERGWTSFTFENYYALLNCGFSLRPTAGSASGVHPVPLGFGRVYVKVEPPFTLDRWIEGLDAGRSFVTTGPMLEVTLDGKLPGTPRELSSEEPRKLKLEAEVISPNPIESVHVVERGDALPGATVLRGRTEEGVHRATLELEVRPDRTTWYCVVAHSRLPDGRLRFAHSAPFHVSVDGKEIRPRPHDIEYLIRRVEAQIERSREVLSPEALEEYEEALEIYRGIQKR